MAGYSDFSKSNNAIEAEHNGAFPATVVARMLRVPTDAVRASGTGEWHHTSGWFNVTDYYDLEAVREWLETDEGREAVAKARAVAKNVEILENVTVRWIKWSGSRNYPRAETREESGCGVVIKGKTATITLPNGSTFTKRTATQGFEIDR